MKIQCVWEHNGNDSLLYAVDLPGAYTRGESRETVLAKMEGEAVSYLRWKGEKVCLPLEIEIGQEKVSELAIRDADSDVLFDSERNPLPWEEYTELKTLAMKSAVDFLTLYEAVPDKHKSVLAERKTFYGTVPRTSDEMYRHTKNVNAYYFGEIEANADNEGTIVECRMRGFEALEKVPDFLKNPVYAGSYGEDWTLRKLLRRFLWHDRIHARAMYRMAVKTFGPDSVPNVFGFEER